MIMAGYMRMVHAPLLVTFPDRVINIHPALLPSFQGAHGIQDAFDRGVKVTGVTVHIANAVYDMGPIIAQRALVVEEGWDVDTLEEHIHAIEHVLYPEVVQMLADGLIRRALFATRHGRPFELSSRFLLKHRSSIGCAVYRRIPSVCHFT